MRGLIMRAAVAALVSARAISAKLHDSTAASWSIDASRPFPVPSVIPTMGTPGSDVSPVYGRLAITNASITLNGSPWLWAAGEVHFSRIAPWAWRDTLLAVKAGGLSSIDVYVFWLHHEETRGVFRFDGQRNVSAFLTVAKEVGLTCLLRIGPWSHGEARDGGHPDWVLALPGIKVRTTDPVYIGLVTKYYNQVAAQLVSGQHLWKSGGAVIAVQLDNEYHGAYPYLLALKKLAQAAGIDVPYYVKTGWPVEPFPANSLLPLGSGYSRQFWHPPQGQNHNFPVFNFTPQGTPPFKQGESTYPILLVEAGGGMTSAYQVRIKLDFRDIGALANSFMGSGANVIGHYIFAGCTQPIGGNTTQEQQVAPGIPGGKWDLPLRSYDFSAPIGEAGQLRPSYHMLRRLYMFFNLAGPWLGGTGVFLPPTSPLKWAVRSTGDSGVLFVTNYVTNTTSLDVPDVQFDVTLSSGRLLLPSTATGAVTIPANAVFAWPFNFPVVPGLVLQQATAQVLTLVTTPSGDATLFLFATLPGPVELVFVGAGPLVVVSCPLPATCTLSPSRTEVTVTGVSPSNAASVLLSGSNPIVKLTAVVLTEDASLGAYVWQLGAQRGVMLVDDPAVHVHANVTPGVTRVKATGGCGAWLFPPPASLLVGGVAVQPTPDGVFGRVAVPSVAPSAALTVSPRTPCGAPRNISIGYAGVAAAPNPDGGDSQWVGAGVWDIVVQPVAGGDGTTAGLTVSVDYVGDAARLYYNGLPVADDFYHNVVWTVALDRLGSDTSAAPPTLPMTLQLRVLPLGEEVQTKGLIYLDEWPTFVGGAACAVQKVALEEYSSTLLAPVA